MPARRMQSVSQDGPVDMYVIFERSLGVGGFQGTRSSLLNSDSYAFLSQGPTPYSLLSGIKITANTAISENFRNF
jgi:hypothetical protein